MNYGWNPRVHVMQSDDFFKTKKMLLKLGNKFRIAKDYFFIAKLEHFAD